MERISKTIPRYLQVPSCLLPLLLGWVLSAPPDGVIRGILTDMSEARVPQGAVSLIGKGVRATVHSDEQGRFAFQALNPGRYTIRAQATNFSPTSQEVILRDGESKEIELRLVILPSREEITVTSETKDRLSTENTLVLRDSKLDDLLDGPGGLVATLRALSPFAGPRGPRILVDGFRPRRLPPKRLISEIRIDENPLSAEFDELGEGQVRIFTKPGTERFSGGAFFSYEDQSFNSRNPFAPEKAAFRSRISSGSFSGPLIPQRSSFFLDFERREMDDNVLVNATILDPSLNPAAFNFAFVKPEVEDTLHSRIDFRINPKHSLTAGFIRTNEETSNEGVGAFSLPSRAHDLSSRCSTFQATERWFISPEVLTEIRLEYAHQRLFEENVNPTPAIRVANSFVGGGSGSGPSRLKRDHWDLNNITFLSRRNHQFRWGGEVRRFSTTDFSSDDFFGSFLFSGGLAPQLDSQGEIARDARGEPLIATVTSLESYRRTLFLEQQGLNASQISERGGGASQFTIAEGDPRAQVRQVEFGAFLQDDWRLAPSFTLSLGLRYEGQTNIQSLDFAPRLGLAWAPGGPAAGKQPATVVRAGFGIFYDRFNPQFTLRANRFNGITQREFIVTDPTILGSFPVAPTPSVLDEFAVPATRVQVAEDLRTPYSLYSVVSVERRLWRNFVLSTSYAHTRTLHALRSRNINAPFPGGQPGGKGLSRPIPGLGPIYQYESSGIFRQHQWTINLIDRSRDSMTWYATYVFDKALTDTDGPDSFPSNPFDLSIDLGRSRLEARHTFYWGAWIKGPQKIMLTPLIVARSGLPFNITTGRDSNGDSLFTERPALASDLSRPSVVATRLGSFDLNPQPGAQIVPRNSGNSPGFFTVNLRVARSFYFGEAGGRSSGGRKNSSSRSFELVLSVDAENILNRVNLGRRVGSLDSPFFGLSTVAAGAFGFGNNPAGNRTINFRIYFRF